jgi:DNA-binding transcriptional ArsR family regulator
MESVDELAELFKALSDPTRLRLLKLLGGGRHLCVNALAKRLGVTQSAVSQHLRILRQAGLVAGSREGSFIHYSLKKDCLGICTSRIAGVLAEGGKQ